MYENDGNLPDDVECICPHCGYVGTISAHSAWLQGAAQHRRDAGESFTCSHRGCGFYCEVDARGVLLDMLTRARP